MVDTHKNEDPELQALKDWWSKYGTAVLVTAILALGLYVGTQTWQRYQESQALSAAEAWAPAEKAFVDGDLETAETLATALRADHANSPYAIQAAMWQAKVAVQNGDYDKAGEHLQWSEAQVKDGDPLKYVLHMRRAMLLAEQKKYDEALALLNTKVEDGFAPAFAEARGDVLIAQGDAEGARGAYAEALAGLQPGQGDRNTLQAKFDDLAVELEDENDA